MILKKIVIKNIRSYSSQEIEFPPGSVLLSGDVGAGKTSLLLAVEYALFGLQPGQNSSALLRNGAPAGEVSLLCEIDGREILLERKLRRNPRGIESEYAAISIDGQKQECSVTELKKKVLTILGYPSEFIKKNNLLYRYTIYTPQEQMKHIILEDPEVRLNILRHIFGIDKYKLIRENAQNLIYSLKEDIRTLQAETKSLEPDMNSLAELKNRLLALRSVHERKQEELLQAAKRKEKSEEEQKQVIDKVKEKDKLESELEKVKIMIVSKKELISSLEKESSEMQKTLSQEMPFDERVFLELLSSLDSQKNLLSGLSEEALRKKTELDYLTRKEGDEISKKNRIFSIQICPTCLQDVPPAHKHNILNEVETTLSRIKSSKEAIFSERKILESRILDEEQKLNFLESQKSGQEILKSKTGYLKQQKEKLGEILRNLERANNDLSLLENHGLAVKETLFSFTNLIPNLKSKDEALRKSLDEEKKIEITIAEIKKEQELTQKEIDALELRLSVKEGIKKKMLDTQEVSDWLLNDFASLMQFIESNVLLQLRSEFSGVFSKWCKILAPESFEVHLDETFTPIIMQGDIEMEYNFLSGGERTAIALAYRLALNQTINSVISMMRTRDLLILDEPTEGFSEAQLEKMREVLAELNVKQLILVSHEPKIEGFVEHVLKIKKEDGFSTLE